MIDEEIDTDQSFQNTLDYIKYLKSSGDPNFALIDI
jgi:hypothetical protein